MAVCLYDTSVLLIFLAARLVHELLTLLVPVPAGCQQQPQLPLASLIHLLVLWCSRPDQYQYQVPRLVLFHRLEGIGVGGRAGVKDLIS